MGFVTVYLIVTYNIPFRNAKDLVKEDDIRKRFKTLVLVTNVPLAQRYILR
jgi:hypothetical protein